MLHLNKLKHNINIQRDNDLIKIDKDERRFKKFDEDHEKVMGRDKNTEKLDEKYIGRGSEQMRSQSLNKLSHILSSFNQLNIEEEEEEEELKTQMSQLNQLDTSPQHSKSPKDLKKNKRSSNFKSSIHQSDIERLNQQSSMLSSPR